MGVPCEEVISVGKTWQKRKYIVLSLVLFFFDEKMLFYLGLDTELTTYCA